MVLGAGDTARGLPDGDVKRIHGRLLTAADAVVGEGAACAVCLAPLAAGECAKSLPACKHTFHDECINAWLRNKADCPVCRAAVAVAPPPPPHHP
jgi:hypothetical protein